MGMVKKAKRKITGSYRVCFEMPVLIAKDMADALNKGDLTLKAYITGLIKKDLQCLGYPDRSAEVMTKTD